MILTLLTLLIVLIGAISLTYYKKARCASSGWEALGMLSLIIGGACLLLILGTVALKEVSADNRIAKIDAVRTTFQRARADKSMYPVENAAIQIKVAEKNEYIAHMQFWAKHPLTNWFWSKRTLDIKPIK